MALVRILVDVYSLLHEWPELAAGNPRHSAVARDTLIQQLARYQDTIETPETISFDDGGASVCVPRAHSTRQVEVPYSKNGSTADDMIERTADRFQEYGEALAVTIDYAEGNTVIHMGGMAESCKNFVYTGEGTLSRLAADVARHNRLERQCYRARKSSPDRP